MHRKPTPAEISRAISAPHINFPRRAKEVPMPSLTIHLTYVKTNRTNVEYRCSTDKVFTGNSVWLTQAFLTQQFGGFPQWIDFAGQSCSPEMVAGSAAKLEDL